MSFWEYTFGERFQLAKPCYVHLSIIRASTHAHRVSKRSLCVFHSHHLLCVQLRTRYVIDLLNWPAKNSAFYRKRNNCNWNGEREQWHFSRKLVVSKIVFSKFLSENEIFFLLITRIVAYAGPTTTESPENSAETDSPQQLPELARDTQSPAPADNDKTAENSDSSDSVTFVSATPATVPRQRNIRKQRNDDREENGDKVIEIGSGRSRSRSRRGSRSSRSR